MCSISVPHLKDIHLGENCFPGLKVIDLNQWEEENVKKIGQFQKCISRKLLN